MSTAPRHEGILSLRGMWRQFRIYLWIETIGGLAGGVACLGDAVWRWNARSLTSLELAAGFLLSSLPTLWLLVSRVGLHRGQNVVDGLSPPGP